MDSDNTAYTHGPGKRKQLSKGMEEEDEQDNHAPPKQKKNKQGPEVEEDTMEPESEDDDMPSQCMYALYISDDH